MKILFLLYFIIMQIKCFSEDEMVTLAKEKYSKLAIRIYKYMELKYETYEKTANNFEDVNNIDLSKCINSRLIILKSIMNSADDAKIKLISIISDKTQDSSLVKEKKFIFSLNKMFRVFNEFEKISLDIGICNMKSQRIYNDDGRVKVEYQKRFRD